eukprot:TRINITY_DN5000_c0_g1_i1.p1 TRINITY_DN5000_c0_g1~~TRINITY_DN5000_c0_g1_i1.p1  ORF type:complete len:706 (+),score=170.20 TRINITY_DN5000_c0_g1_i1:31-2118(+)
MADVYYLSDLKPTSLPILSYDEHRSRGTPIVIDNGAWECRVGWAGDHQPKLQYRNVLAKTRKEKGKESELLVGSDITNIEAVRHALKSPFDRDVVTHYEASEHLLDYAFSQLGIDHPESVPHPVVITETLGQPNASRHLYSHLLFELYGVPSIAFGVDFLFSLRANVPKIKDALVVSLSHQTIHVLPILDGIPQLNKSRRLNLGGAQLAHFLQKTLQLKYPNHVNNVTLSRAEEMLLNHTCVVSQFFDQLKLWKDTDYYDDNVRKIQLPFTVAPKAPPTDPEVLKAKRQELAKRLIEINARKRDERLVVDEANVRQMLIVKDIYEQGYETKFMKALAKLNLGLSNINQLESAIDKLKARIEKAKESKMRSDQGIREEKVEPEIKKKREDMDENEKKDFDTWLSDIRNKFGELKEKKQARIQRRQQLAKRRTAASQERMRIISQLARHTKKEDTFGMEDDDWDVYKKISKDGGDSDSEEEALRCAEYEAVLREHDPQDEEVGRDNPEWHQIHLATETIRTPEIIFQPSMIGHEQAGLGELLEFVLGKFEPDVADRLANSIFLTGGLSNIAGLKERLEAELQCMRPFQSTFKVSLAGNTSLDAWRGASIFGSNNENLKSFLTKEMFSECGEGYLEEHFHSNRYFPTPPPAEKNELISNPATPSIKEEISNPSTPKTIVDFSNPPSPHNKASEPMSFE